MAMKRKGRVPAGTTLATPVIANAGVGAAYRKQLQGMVREMAQDMLTRVRRVWPGFGFAHDTAMLPRAAGVIFTEGPSITKGGLFLLLHRTDGLGWALPGGGLEPGETFQQAVRREVREEIGISYEGPLDFVDVQGGRVRYATFRAMWPGGTPQLNHEHDAYRFVTPAEALTLPLHPGVRATLVEMSMAMDAKAKSPSVLLQKALADWGVKWNTRFDQASTKIAWNFAAKNRDATTRQVVRTLTDAGFAVRARVPKAVQRSVEAVVAENVGLIKSIPQRYLTDVEAVVWDGVRSGNDMATVSQRLQQKYGIADRRAALIARDQNHKAKAAIERAQRLDAGITRAVWQHSHAGVEPRETHVAMNEQEYDVAQGMWDSAVQKYVWPGTEINCRCTDRAVIPGFG